MEPHVDYITKHIIKAKNNILKKIDHTEKDMAHSISFVTFWDFDGTIIKGDCTEGYSIENEVIYKGLGQIIIESGLSKTYKSNEFKLFWKKYETIIAEKGDREAYIYGTKLCQGMNRNDIITFAQNYFESTLNKYYFISSMEIIKRLKSLGIEIYIISASPDYFVKGASKSIGVDSNNLYGIELEHRNNIFGNSVLEPVNYGSGKIETIQRILSSIKSSQKKKEIYILAGFGNSKHTDGPFLQWIQEQPLPAGSPLSVMINDSPYGSDDTGFYNVEQQTTYK